MTRVGERGRGPRPAILAAALLALFVLCSCVAGEVPDLPSDEAVIASVTDPLSNSAIQWLNGTYTSCIGRTGSWSARVSGSATMENEALSVVKNDTGCQLRLTSVQGDVKYTTASPILLGTSYAGSASTFGSGQTAFYGNAKLESAGYASDFQITFVHNGGDNAPPVIDATVTGAYATVSSSVATQIATPPSYTLDISNLRFTADMIQLIVTLTGSATLVNGLVTGNSYAIDSTLGANPTYAQTRDAYDAAVLTQKTISGANPTIQASEFSVVALSILGSTQVRNIIVKRTVAGVSAYQIFRVTFIS